MKATYLVGERVATPIGFGKVVDIESELARPVYWVELEPKSGQIGCRCDFFVEDLRPVKPKTYTRELVRVPVGTNVSEFELANHVIVLSAKDCGSHYEFWAI